MFPQLAQFQDLALLILRVMAAAVFLDSGWKHVKDPEARGKSIEMSKSATAFIGLAEILGGLGVLFGVLTQLAAIGLILVMLGAIEKKVFVWHTGFWGKQGQGWHYDLMFVVMNLVILTTNGGTYVLLRGSGW
jgi:putative oxidoreductase